MKILVNAVLAILIAAGSLSAAQRGTTILRKTGESWRGKVEWHKKIVDGADSLFSIGSDTVAVNGSVKDTLETVTYFAKDHNSIALNIYGGTTTRLTATILTANLGNWTGNSTSYSGFGSIPDSVYKEHSWLTTGTGVNGDKVSTTADSIVANKYTLPIELYLTGQQVFKLRIICSLDQVGNTRISGDIWQKED